MVTNSKVYIHLGLHKTGTTFFQKSLYPSHSEFNYKSLRDAPELADFNEYILRENSLSFSLKTALSLFYKNFESHEMENQLFTICEEQFSGFPLLDAYNRKTNFDRLNNFFPQANYIIVLRNQKDFVKSMYGEYLKKGGTASLKQFLRRSDSQLSFSRGSYLKYFQYYNYIVNKVTAEKVKVLFYEDMKHEPQHFFRELFSFYNLEISLEEVDLTVTKNVSSPINIYNSVRFYNKIGKSSYGKDHIISSRFKKTIIKLHHKISKKHAMDEELINSFLHSFEFQNELLPDYERVKKYGY